MAHKLLQPAPVLIMTYTRYNHLWQTVEALKKNYLADQTDLFIASDYQKTDKDKEAVDKVRDYIYNIDGFKSITPVLREKNYGYGDNFYKSKEKIYENYDRLIFMEDDIVTAPGFLKFINDGLDAYQDNQDIYAICGYLYYCQQQFVSTYNQVCLHGFNTWGYGVWREKEKSIERGVKFVKEFIRNPRFFVEMNRAAPDLFPNAVIVAEKNLVAEDVIIHLNMIKQRRFCIFPFKSLVRNIGLDGSGIHCVRNDVIGQQEIYEGLIEITPITNPFEDKKNTKLIYKYFGGTKKMMKYFATLFPRYVAKLLLPRLFYRKCRDFIRNAG